MGGGGPGLEVGRGWQPGGGRGQGAEGLWPEEAAGWASPLWLAAGTTGVSSPHCPLRDRPPISPRGPVAPSVAVWSPPGCGAGLPLAPST